jgi:hypothetical protein
MTDSGRVAPERCESVNPSRHHHEDPQEANAKADRSLSITGSHLCAVPWQSPPAATPRQDQDAIPQQDPTSPQIMSTQAERQVAAIKRQNDLLKGWSEPSLSAEEQRTRRAQILVARSAYASDDDQEQPVQPQPPKAYPLSRAKLRKVIEAAVQKGFDETVFSHRHISTAFETSVAVGCAELVFDESDPVFLTGSMRYEHGEATRKESEVILDRMASVLVSDHMGPAKGFIEPIGAHADFAGPEKLFKVEFKVRCPA